MQIYRKSLDYQDTNQISDYSFTSNNSYSLNIFNITFLNFLQTLPHKGSLLFLDILYKAYIRFFYRKVIYYEYYSVVQKVKKGQHWIIRDPRKSISSYAFETRLSAYKMLYILQWLPFNSTSTATVLQLDKGLPLVKEYMEIFYFPAMLLYNRLELKNPC